METLFPEIKPVLPELLDENLGKEILLADNPHIFLYEQFRVAHSFGLTRFILDVSNKMDTPDPTLEGRTSQVFAQGMLFAIAVGDMWLGDDDWDQAIAAAENVDDDIRSVYLAANEDPDIEMTLWETIFDYGTEGVDEVVGYAELIDKYVWIFEQRMKLHEHFRAGAGIMMRVLVVARHMRNLEQADSKPAKVADNLMEQIGQFLAEHSGA